MRHLGATLNWRRDPDYEQSIVLHEQRMKQLESETEQLRQENARGRQLLAKIDALTLGGSGRFWHAKGEELPW